MPRKGSIGTSMTPIESKASKARKARRRRREEAAWKARNGPVTITYLPGRQPR